MSLFELGIVNVLEINNKNRNCIHVNNCTSNVSFTMVYMVYQSISSFGFNYFNILLKLLIQV